jgi:hypothetical protein
MSEKKIFSLWNILQGNIVPNWNLKYMNFILWRLPRFFVSFAILSKTNQFCTYAVLEINIFLV